uniref:Uncharacterized protein n=1 Tax=Arundo donax TaxID=35708 RepID=A0A0A9CM35_ARUDO
MKVGVAYPDTVTASSSLRRVLLPPCRFQDDVVSLSPLGLTRIFKGSNADGKNMSKFYIQSWLCIHLFLMKELLMLWIKGFQSRRILLLSEILLFAPSRDICI